MISKFCSPLRDCHQMSRGSIAIAFALLIGTTAITTARAQDRPFQFGLIGDTGYTSVGIEEFKRLLAAINRMDLAFVVHVGDFQADPRGWNPNPTRGPEPCTDERYKDVYESFQSVKHPLILTPGDNDWTDCVHLQVRKVDALQLLSKVRTMFFPEGRSLGQRAIAVQSQKADPAHDKFVENLRWSMGGMTFATIHIVGSNDNYGRAPEMDAEHVERKAANIAWMKEAFARAKADNSRGLVLMIQANPGFENHWPARPKQLYFALFRGVRPPDPPQPTGYDDYIKVLAEELESYEKPVAFLHGDTHTFRIDQPLFSKKTNRRFENFTRVETFGDPETHWVRVTVDPADPQLFRFNAEIIPENVVNHRK
jgi:hypothetical protein